MYLTQNGWIHLRYLFQTGIWSNQSIQNMIYTSPWLWIIQTELSSKLITPAINSYWFTLHLKPELAHYEPDLTHDDLPLTSDADETNELISERNNKIETQLVENASPYLNLIKEILSNLAE